MEEVRAARRGGGGRKLGGAATAAYGDVFGGPPKYAAAAVSADYADIFGGLATACSIPFLDLPPPPAPGSGGDGIDYDEIFGAFCGDIGLSYDELVGLEMGPTREEPTVVKEIFHDQNAKEIAISPENGDFGDKGACSEKESFLSSSYHSDDGCLRINMSLHKRQGGNMVDTRIEDSKEESTGISQVNSNKSYNHVLGVATNIHNEPNDVPTNLHNELNDVPANVRTNDPPNEDSLIRKGEHEDVLLSSSPSHSAQSSIDGQRDQEPLAAGSCVSENASEDRKSHSRSSSYHSTSSGDVSYTDATFITISDINLHTQPIPVPPPSRPPPKLVNMQGSSMTRTPGKAVQEDGICRSGVNHKIKTSEGVTKVRLLATSADSHASFRDVPIDAKSAAEASAAAMKEAMEQAEARLKSAKEFMERKRENSASRKLEHNRGMPHKDKINDKFAQKGLGMSETIVQPTFADDNSQLKISEEKKQEVKFTSVNSSKEKTETQGDHEFQKKVPYETFNLSLIVDPLVQGDGEWKQDEEFYELINHEKKVKVVKEVSAREVSDKKSEATRNHSGERENESKGAKKNRKMWEINDARELEVKSKILRAGNMVSNEEEVKEKTYSIPDAYFEIENVSELDVTQVSQTQNKRKENFEATQVKQAAQEKKDVWSPDEDLPRSGKLINEPKICGDDHLHSKHCKVKEEEWKLQSTDIHKRAISQNDDIATVENEWSTANASLERQQTEEDLLLQKAAVQNGGNKSVEDLSGSCLIQSAKGIETPQGAIHCEPTEKIEGPTDTDYFNDANLTILRGTDVALQIDEITDLNGTQEERSCLDNKETLEVDEDVFALNKDVEKLNISEETLGQNELDEDAESDNQVCQRSQIDTSAAEIHVDVSSSEKQDMNQSVVKHYENSLTAEEGQEHGKYEDEDAWASNLEKHHETTSADEESFQKARDFLAVDQVKLPASCVNDPATLRNSHKVKEKTCFGAREVKEKQGDNQLDREKEEEKERNRKLEEEREREREREKDRLAVERATRDAHERALAEARERAERLAVERATAEARQRALAEAKEKAERAAAEALEKSQAEKESREARLKAERAAVERATAEARERAMERARAERAALDAREHTERLNGPSRERLRKDPETDECFRVNGKEDSGRRRTTTSEVPSVNQRQNLGPSNSFERYSQSNGSQTESALRRKARLERHQRTVERAAKALAEKNMRDILAQREQAERDRLAESLDLEIKRWSAGKEGNLRALLSTLQYILGPNSGWQPVPLTEVITSTAVKKAYRKATLCVHPDKLQQRGASIQHKYICEKVFDLLKEAWNRFNSEER